MSESAILVFTSISHVFCISFIQVMDAHILFTQNPSESWGYGLFSLNNLIVFLLLIILFAFLSADLSKNVFQTRFLL